MTARSISATVSIMQRMRHTGNCCVFRMDNNETVFVYWQAARTLHSWESCSTQPSMISLQKQAWRPIFCRKSAKLIRTRIRKRRRYALLSRLFVYWDVKIREITVTRMASSSSYTGTAQQAFLRQMSDYFICLYRCTEICSCVTILPAGFLPAGFPETFWA